jgi:hypothetical protein
MIRKWFVVACLAVCGWQGMAMAQADDEERMDTALRKFGYVTGKAFACHTKDEQAKLERTALGIATNILRLFGSDRAFFYAAAFGAGAAEPVDAKGCPAVLKEAETMVQQMKVLASR